LLLDLVSHLGKSCLSWSHFRTRRTAAWPACPKLPAARISACIIDGLELVLTLLLTSNSFCSIYILQRRALLLRIPVPAATHTPLQRIWLGPSSSSPYCREGRGASGVRDSARGAGGAGIRGGRTGTSRAGAFIGIMSTGRRRIRGSRERAIDWRDAFLDRTLLSNPKSKSSTPSDEKLFSSSGGNTCNFH
jgi:hypothetical protein